MTGGAGTLALVNARALLEHGLTGLALLDLDSSHAATEIQSLKTDFPQAQIFTVHVDVTSAEELAQCIDLVYEKLGSIDHLLCFAGVVGCTHALDISPTEWTRTLNINTTGAFLAAQAAARHMKEQGTGGTILFTASISAHRTNFPQPQAAYNASKAALISLKSSLAAEWAVHGIRVNNLSPGYMDTILNAGEGVADARKVWAERNPMGRMGVPEELTGVVVLLCSGAGTYINGADFVVDGGQCCF